MTRNEYTIEDCLEMLVGLVNVPGSTYKEKHFKLYPENSKVLYSIGTQVFRGKALTEKQHHLVKKLLTEWYVDQFQAVNIDVFDHLDKLREAYREVDKSHWVKVLTKDNNTYIGIRFPFSNSVIDHINDLKKTTDTDYFYDRHVHYFVWNEINVFKVMNVANKFKEKFDIEPQVQDYYNQVIEFDMSKDTIIPGVRSNEFVNIPAELQTYLENKYNVKDDIVSIWDKRRLYGLHSFENIDISDYSPLSQKILNRKNSSVVIRSEVWNIEQVLNSLYEIDRLPIIIALDPDVGATDHLTIIYNAVKGFIDTKNISVMFRLDNKTNGEFNQFIRDKGLNNSIDDNTQIVIVNRKKITKPIIKSNWQPVCMLTFGQSRGYGNIFSSYCEQFDLKLYYTKEDSIISQYTKTKDDYHAGVTTL